jgi:hypothetical protein
LLQTVFKYHSSRNLIWYKSIHMQQCKKYGTILFTSI